MFRSFLIAALVLFASLVGTVQVQAEDEPATRVDAAKPDVAQVAQWKKQLGEWRRWFLSEKLDPERSPDLAREKIVAIDDPAAVPALIAALKTEKNPRFRLVLVEPLISIGGKDAVAYLVKLSVEDDNPLLRENACVGLTHQPEFPGRLDEYIAYLKVPRFAARAAEALKWTGVSQPISQASKPNTELTKALIDALNTTEEKIVPYRIAYDSGWIVGPLPASVIGNGAHYARIRGYEDRLVKVRIPVPQPKVLNTLQEYTGRDYQYSQSEWNRWLTDSQ